MNVFGIEESSQGVSLASDVDMLCLDQRLEGLPVLEVF